MALREFSREQLMEALSIDWKPSFDGDLDYKMPQVEVIAQAAVMILINNYDPIPNFVLTLRGEGLNKHSGQVSFPGGRRDEGDLNLWETARRETEEEIGLPAGHSLLRMGEMSKHLTITGYEVTPFVALNDARFDYIPEPREVAEVFEVPYALLRTENFELGHQIWRGKRRNYWVLPFEGYYIWGATARILHQLAARLEYVS